MSTLTSDGFGPGRSAPNQPFRLSQLLKDALGGSAGATQARPRRPASLERYVFRTIAQRGVSEMTSADISEARGGAASLVAVLDTCQAAPAVVSGRIALETLVGLLPPLGWRRAVVAL